MSTEPNDRLEQIRVLAERIADEGVAYDAEREVIETALEEAQELARRIRDLAAGS